MKFLMSIGTKDNGATAWNWFTKKVTDPEAKADELMAWAADKNADLVIMAVHQLPEREEEETEDEE